MTMQSSESRLDRIESAIAELTAQNIANSRDIAHLVETGEETARNLDRLTGLTERFIDASMVLTESLKKSTDELKAGQEQQARVLDYLLRKEQERQG
jgi:hypothetical protein